MEQLEDYVDKSTLKWCKGIFSTGIIVGVAGVIADSEALTIYGGIFAGTGILGHIGEYGRAWANYLIKENENKK